MEEKENIKINAKVSNSAIAQEEKSGQGSDSSETNFKDDCTSNSNMKSEEYECQTCESDDKVTDMDLDNSIENILDKDFR